MSELFYDGPERRIEWASDQGDHRGKRYFERLRPRDKAKFEALFRLLADKGRLNREQLNNEGEGIWAFKIHGHRMLCFFHGRIVYITHGCRKKRQKMEVKEIARAKRIRDRYLRKNGRA